jgi:hypothetical protein
MIMTKSLLSFRWLGCQDSNLGSWFQRPLPYRLATPERRTERDLEKPTTLYRTPSIVHDEGVFVNTKRRHFNPYGVGGSSGNANPQSSNVFASLKRRVASML